MNQEDKQTIERLIRKYESLTPVQRRNYNESMACKDFILPLFKALGWDVFNSSTEDEVTSETQIARKRVDYAFHISGVTHFFLEAKRLSADLREEKWAEQAVMYAWYKGAAWAVLTNFESIKVFNAEWDEPDPERSLLFEISYKDYLTDERLLWLSRGAFRKGLLDKYASESFKKPKREPVDKQLANDLIRWRNILFTNLRKWNSERRLTPKHIAESVQRILDRLIFIRTTEDRGIEDNHLQELVRSYRENKKGFDLIEEIKKLFLNYDGWYNSKLFEKHACDTLEYESSFLADVIDELYKNKKGIRYDFSFINADVLGSIYEQYLGHVQQVDVDEKKSKRKEQGIFYTPRYIVEYIVGNTLGEALKGKQAHEALKVKVLDPACGSGSFLLNAFGLLDDYIARKSGHTDSSSVNAYIRRSSILTSNIYGVDLDPEAVEIAQLNLLLKVVSKQERLPNLAHNIECGNSLVDGSAELKRYFGVDWRGKRPFNWKEVFPEVFEHGGFDVVIGNPPYIDSEEMVKSDKSLRNYCVEKYESAKGNWDIFCIFLERALNLTKEGGYVGMIVPNKLLSADYAESIRELIKRFSIISLSDYSSIKVFGASVYPIVIVIKKEKPSKNHLVTIKLFKEEGEKIKLFESGRCSVDFTSYPGLVFSFWPVTWR